MLISVLDYLHSERLCNFLGPNIQRTVSGGLRLRRLGLLFWFRIVTFGCPQLDLCPRQSLRTAGKVGEVPPSSLQNTPAANDGKIPLEIRSQMRDGPDASFSQRRSKIDFGGDSSTQGILSPCFASDTVTHGVLSCVPGAIVRSHNRR